MHLASADLLRRVDALIWHQRCRCGSSNQRKKKKKKHMRLQANTGACTHLASARLGRCVDAIIEQQRRSVGHVASSNIVWNDDGRDAAADMGQTMRQGVGGKQASD